MKFLRHPVTITMALLVLGYVVARGIVTVYALTHEPPRDLFAYADQEGDVLALLIVFFVLWLAGIVAFHIWRHRRALRRCSSSCASR
jgi:glycerol-3-phosphate acyltransferase PlsY